MTPEQFVAKWNGSQLGERRAAQEQFIDLCRLLDEKTPAEVDATGESYVGVRLPPKRPKDDQGEIQASGQVVSSQGVSVLSASSGSHHGD